MPFNALLTAFVLDVRTLVLAVLIVADLVTGVLAALRTRSFSLEKLGQWLITDVQYFIGYAVWYLFSQAALGAFDLGEASSFLGFGTASASLLASIVGNSRYIREGTPQPPREGLTQ